MANSPRRLRTVSTSSKTDTSDPPPRRRVGRPRSVDSPHPIDINIGHRLRLRRTLLGLTQTDLGRRVNLTFQQIQKYERGTNRISASRLVDFSRSLDVPITYFFEDVQDLPQSPMSPELAAAESAGESTGMKRRETLELARAYYSIEDPLIRKRLVGLIRAVGQRAGIDIEV